MQQHMLAHRLHGTGSGSLAPPSLIFLRRGAATLQRREVSQAHREPRPRGLPSSSLPRAVATPPTHSAELGAAASAPVSVNSGCCNKTALAWLAYTADTRSTAPGWDSQTGVPAGRALGEGPFSVRPLLLLHAGAHKWTHHHPSQPGSLRAPRPPAAPTSCYPALSPTLLPRSPALSPLRSTAARCSGHRFRVRRARGGPWASHAMPLGAWDVLTCKTESCLSPGLAEG